MVTSKFSKMGIVFGLIKQNIGQLLLLGCLVSVCYAMISVFLTGVSGLLINWAIYNDEKNLFYLLFSVGISIPLAMLIIFTERLKNRKVCESMENVRRNILNRILKIDLSLKKVSGGQALTGITKDIEYIKQFYFTILPNAIDTIITGLVMIVITGLIEWRLLILTLVCGMVLILTRKIIEKINNEEVVFQRAEAELTEYSRSMYRCLPLFHIYNGCIRFAELILHKNTEIKEIDNKRNELSALLSFLITFINLIREFGILIYGTVWLKIPLGYAVVLTNYTSYINNMFADLIDAFLELTKASVAAAHIHSLLNIPEEKIEQFGNEVVKDVHGVDKSYLIISNLNYLYGDNQVLFNVELKIKKGQILGLMGAVGSGKSTLAKILAGIYPIQSGNLYWNGSLQDSSSLRELAAYVDQQAFLFDGTIKENICCFSEADDALIEYAVDASGLKSFIASLPDGLDTILNQEQRSLSGGEQQRVAIARALVKNTQIIIFDEPTSALDNETQQYVLDTIYRLREEKTIIMISHRLKTLEGADKILQIENGRILNERIS